jgi:hypothetical protein
MICLKIFANRTLGLLESVNTVAVVTKLIAMRPIGISSIKKSLI